MAGRGAELHRTPLERDRRRAYDEVRRLEAEAQSGDAAREFNVLQGCGNGAPLLAYTVRPVGPDRELAPGDPAAVAAAFVAGANAEAPVAALGAGVPQAGVQRLGSMGMLFLSVPVVRTGGQCAGRWCMLLSFSPVR